MQVNETVTLSGVKNSTALMYVTDGSLELDSHWGQVSEGTQFGDKGVWQRASRTGPLACLSLSSVGLSG